MTNLTKWIERYELELRQAAYERPELYTWNYTKVAEVVRNMRDAFERGSYNKDSLAIRRTCKHFGVKHTYGAINAFLKGEPC